MFLMFVGFFFFFKQKTAYEMRISDWSSDVCSSDLMAVARDIAGAAGAGAELVSRLLQGRQHGRMLAHAEVVVRAPDGDFFGPDAAEIIGDRKTAAVAGQLGEHPVAPLGVPCVDRLAEKGFVIPGDRKRGVMGKGG